VPKVEAGTAYGQLTLRCVERLGLLVVDETGPALLDLHPVEEFGNCLARVCYRLLVVGAEHSAALVYLEEGASAKVFTPPAKVSVLGLLSDALTLLFALVLILAVGRAVSLL
jgi:hypothetical protein